MPVTARGIWTPSDTDAVDFTTHLATMAGTVDTAITNRLNTIGAGANAFKGTASQRIAFTSTAVNGMLWRDTDSIKMLWAKDGAAWVPAIMRWSGTTSQMNAFIQAPNGFEWFNTTDSSDYVRLGGVWRTLFAYGQLHGINKNISSSYSPMTWNASDPGLDTGGFAVPGQNTRLNIPRSGVYRISYNLRQNGVTSSSCALYLNGSPMNPTRGTLDYGANGELGAAVTMGTSGLFQLSAGDYLELWVVSSSTVSGTMWMASSTFSAELVRAL